jgi:hypothetical protein
MQDSSAESGTQLQRVASGYVVPVTSILALLAMLLTGFFWVDKTYARNDTVQQLNQRFELKLASDTLQGVTARIWQLEDRLEARPNDTTAKEELRKLRAEKGSIERRVESLQTTK